MRSKYGLHRRSAVQLIEDALRTDPQIGYQSAAVPSPLYTSPANPATSFPQEQARQSPHKHKQASAQAVVPSGVYSLNPLVVQMHVNYHVNVTLAQQQSLV